MDIHKLEYFFQAADEGNFTRAADHCQIAQTTMSKYISNLEAEFNCELFYRTNKGCELTEQGKLFYKHAKQLATDYQTLMRAMTEGDSSSLRLGIDGLHFYIGLLKEFENTHPDIPMHVSIGTSASLFDDLTQQRIHALLVPNVLFRTPSRHSNLRTLDILTANDYLVIPRTEYERYGSIESAIENLPFITKSEDPAYHDFCRDQLRREYHTTFRNITVAPSQADQVSLLRLSQGFCVLTETENSDDLPASDYIVQPLGPDFRETLQIIYNRSHMTPSLKVLLQFIRVNRDKAAFDRG